MKWRVEGKARPFVLDEAHHLAGAGNPEGVRQFSDQAWDMLRRASARQATGWAPKRTRLACYPERDGSVSGPTPGAFVLPWRQQAGDLPELTQPVLRTRARQSMPVHLGSRVGEPARDRKKTA